MIIKNGNLLNKDFEFVKADIEFDEKITYIGENAKGEKFFDADGMYVIPGLVDTHMHGGFGELFLDFKEGTVEQICSREAKRGTTTLTPTISGAPEEKMKKACRFVAEKAKNLPEDCAKILGIHLEGPFFAPKYKGAHKLENLRCPSIEEFDRLKEACGGLAKLITMAPETQGGYEVVKHITTTSDVSVSVGHTDATFEEAMKAFETGADRTTHTYNAMTPLHHRAPGVVGAALVNDNVTSELICDFFHVHPGAVKVVLKAKGYDKVTMITDSVLGAGMPDGEYIENEAKVIIKDGQARLPDGTIAGGSSVLLDGVKNLVTKLEVPLEMAVKMASYNGAKAIKAQDRIGSLDVGKDADIVVLDKDLNLVKVFLNGKEIV